MSSYCPKCGTGVGPEDRFCASCGQALHAAHGQEQRNHQQHLHAAPHMQAAPVTERRRGSKMWLILAVLIIAGAGGFAYANPAAVKDIQDQVTSFVTQLTGSVTSANTEQTGQQRQNDTNRQTGNRNNY